MLILERVDSLSIKPLPSVQHLTSLLQVYSFWSKVRLVAVSHTPRSTYLPGVEVVEHFEMNIFGVGRDCELLCEKCGNDLFEFCILISD